MSDLYNTIESMCMAKRISITKMCAESGASRGSLTDLKKGRIETLTMPTLCKISDYFGVPISVIVGDKTKKSPPVSVELTDEEMQIVMAYRKADEKSRGLVLYALNDYMESAFDKMEISESVL